MKTTYGDSEPSAFLKVFVWNPVFTVSSAMAGAEEKSAMANDAAATPRQAVRMGKLQWCQDGPRKSVSEPPGRCHSQFSHRNRSNGSQSAKDATLPTHRFGILWLLSWTI